MPPRRSSAQGKRRNQAAVDTDHGSSTAATDTTISAQAQTMVSTMSSDRPAAEQVNTSTLPAMRANATCHAPPTPAVDPSLLTPGRVDPPVTPCAPPPVDLAGILEQMRRMQEQLDRYQGGQGIPDTSPESAADAATMAAQQGSSTRAVQALENVPEGSIPKPKGCAGGGKKGFHLQEEMGLTDDEDGDRIYNMILSTVRELAHAARIDLSRPYRDVPAEDLSRIFSMARKIHPFLLRFQNDWATAAILKQYMSSTRRYGKRKGYFSCRAEARGPRRRLEDM